MSISYCLIRTYILEPTKQTMYKVRKQKFRTWQQKTKIETTSRTENAPPIRHSNLVCSFN